MMRIKLTRRQIAAMELAGAFEPPMDQDSEILSASLQGQELVVEDQNRMVGILYDMGNHADDFASGILTCEDATLRRGYRADREIF